MGKYLLLIGGALLVFWLVRASFRRRRRDQAQHRQAPVQDDMVRCAECGVHLPRSESLVTRGEFYCCVDHQRRHGPEA